MPGKNRPAKCVVRPLANTCHPKTESAKAYRLRLRLRIGPTLPTPINSSLRSDNSPTRTQTPTPTPQSCNVPHDTTPAISTPDPGPHYIGTDSQYTGPNHTGSQHTGLKHTGSQYTGPNHTGSQYTGSINIPTGGDQQQLDWV